jgi:hypothetical protein
MEWLFEISQDGLPIEISCIIPIFDLVKNLTNSFGLEFSQKYIT